MAEIVLHGLDRDSGAQRGDGVAVAQIVRMQGGDADLRADAVQAFADDDALPVLAAAAGEYKAVVDPFGAGLQALLCLRDALIAQNRNCLVGQFDRPRLAVFRFGHSA